MLRTASARLVRWVTRRSMGTSPVAHGRHDALEILRRGVAASEERHFLAVEIRIHERDRVLDHADEHVAAAMGDELETPFHRLPVARRVEYNIKAIAPSRASRPPPKRRSRREWSPLPTMDCAAAARSGSRSNTATLAPDRRANSATPRPIGPAPTTSTRSRLVTAPASPRALRSPGTPRPRIGPTLRPGARMRLPAGTDSSPAMPPSW